MGFAYVTLRLQLIGRQLNLSKLIAASMQGWEPCPRRTRQRLRRQPSPSSPTPPWPSIRRGKKAISEMNAELVEMATEDEVFLDSAPELFGKTFASNAKQRADELRCLKQVQHKKPFLGHRRPHEYKILLI